MKGGTYTQKGKAKPRPDPQPDVKPDLKPTTQTDEKPVKSVKLSEK